MNKRGIILLVIGIALILLVVGFIFNPFAKISFFENKDNVTISNPASVYCIEQGGELDIRTDENGGQYGVCVLANGSECEEWKFFRGDCKDSSLSSCLSDFDCVPDSCCHSSGCVNAVNAPNCSDVFCTMECSPGTLDCGQGSCECINQKCEAVLT
jgi:putative hemolysin